MNKLLSTVFYIRLDQRCLNIIAYVIGAATEIFQLLLG